MKLHDLSYNRKSLDISYVGGGDISISGLLVDEAHSIDGPIKVINNGTIITGWWYFSELLKSLKVLGYSEATVDDDSSEVISKIRNYEESLRLLLDKDVPVELEVCKDFKGELYEVQKRGVIGLLSRRAFGLFDEMGLGKTVETIYAYGLLRQYVENCKCLVVCPKEVKLEWQEAFQKFMGIESSFIEDSLDSEISLAHFEQFIDRKVKDKVHESELIKQVRKITFDAIIVDEAHFIKNYTSKRTKAVLSLLNSKPRPEGYINPGKLNHSMLEYQLTLPVEWHLTGTPMERPADIYQFLRRCYGKNFMGYKEFMEFFTNKEVVYTKFRGQVIPREVSRGIKNEDILYSLISNTSLRRERSEIVEIPFIERTIELDLDIKTRKVYHEVLNSCRNSLERITRGAQFCNNPGILRLNEEKETNKKLNKKLEKIDSVKYKTLLNLVKGTKDKVVVWTVFTEAVDQIVAMLNKNKIKAVGYRGGDDRKEVEKKFKKDHQIIVATIAKGHVGVNFMKTANTVIYLEKPFSYTMWTQSRDRVMRIDRDMSKPVLFIELKIKESVHKIFDDCMDKKMELKDYLLCHTEKVKECLLEKDK